MFVIKTHRTYNALDDSELLSHCRTQHDSDAFAEMKDGVHLINMTWMGLFEEEALIGALKSGKVAGLMAERPHFNPAEPHPLMDFDNVVFTPAVGSHSAEGQNRCGVEAADLAIAYLENGELNNEIEI